METLGERIGYYRKNMGISQEKLAEKAGVSRQAVTKWESNKSAPATDNLIRLADIFGIPLDELTQTGGRKPEPVQPVQISKSPAVCCALSLACTAAYGVIGAVTGELQIEILIIMIVISAMMQLFVHLYLVNAVKTEDFNGIAGFENNVEYNMAELKKLLIRMDLWVSGSSTGYVMLFFACAYIETNLTELLLMLYTINFIGIIAYSNIRSMDRIFVHDIDKKRAQAGWITTGIFIAVVLGMCGEMFILMGVQEIKNNSPGALRLLGYIIMICIVITVGLFVEQFRIKKLDLSREPYKVGKVFWGSLALSLAMMAVMALECMP